MSYDWTTIWWQFFAMRKKNSEKKVHRVTVYSAHSFLVTRFFFSFYLREKKFLLEVEQRGGRERGEGGKGGVN